MYFYRGVLCKYFGAHGTESRVVHVVTFCGGPKFEGKVCILNPSGHTIISRKLNPYVLLPRGACEYFCTYQTQSPVVHVVGFEGGPKFESKFRRLIPSAIGPHDNLFEIYMYFCLWVACEYSGVYRTRSHVVRVVGFCGGLKFEANVRRLNPSATGPNGILHEI